MFIAVFLQLVNPAAGFAPEQAVDRKGIPVKNGSVINGPANRDLPPAPVD
jgi:hypothetical protein